MLRRGLDELMGESWMGGRVMGAGEGVEGDCGGGVEVIRHESVLGVFDGVCRCGWRNI